MSTLPAVAARDDTAVDEALPIARTRHPWRWVTNRSPLPGDTSARADRVAPVGPGTVSTLGLVLRR